MNEEERRVIYSDAEHLKAAFKVRGAAAKATQTTQRRFGNIKDDTVANAFRHALWNCEAACLIGPRMAREFTNAHEAGDTTARVEQTRMDLHNNNVGLDLATEPSTCATDSCEVERLAGPELSALGLDGVYRGDIWTAFTWEKERCTWRGLALPPEAIELPHSGLLEKLTVLERLD